MLRNLTSLLALLVVLGFTSCESYFEGVNTNPNRPTKVSVDVMLPSLQVEVADLYGGDFARFASILTQQAEGVARQWTSINNYSGYVPSAFNQAWINTYANVFNESKLLREQAAEEGYNHYEGAASILEAFHLINATDVWNEIPYSEAFQGLDNLAPKFDSQESIYNAALALLDAGIAKLGGPVGVAAMGEDDLIYGGDTASWIAAANGIKARAYLHLANRDGNYQRTLDAVRASFGDASSSFDLQFGTTQTSAGPWYRFIRDRTGDIEMHPTYINIMTAVQDTNRLNMLVPTFAPGHPYMVVDFNQPLVTYREMKFVEAECLYRLDAAGNAAEIKAAYEEGIRASFANFGVGGADELLANADVNPDVITLEHIMIQKAIALWGTLEPYNDWRRTDIPNLSPNDGVAIPTRWPYGDSEVLFNSTTPSVVTTDKVWWDQ